MNLINKLKDSYDDVWKGIIMPQRQRYSQEHIGPRQRYVQNQLVKAQNLQIKNRRNENLECTYFSCEQGGQKPIVVYLHGNSGSQLEALTTMQFLLPKIELFAFDFSGSGKSEGKYVTMGLNEHQDLEVVIEYIRNNINPKSIIVWGRSMGAVTAIIYSAKFLNSVQLLILDSPFSDLQQVMGEIAAQKTNFPRFIIDMVISIIKSKIEEELSDDLFKFDLKKEMSKIKIPALFTIAEGDTTIQPYHSEILYKCCKSQKQKFEFDGNHNTLRPKSFFDTVQKFIQDYLLQPDKNSQVVSPRIAPKNYNVSNKFQNYTNLSRISLNDDQALNKIYNNSFRRQKTVDSGHSKGISMVQTSKNQNYNMNSIEPKKQINFTACRKQSVFDEPEKYEVKNINPFNSKHIHQKTVTDDITLGITTKEIGSVSVQPIKFVAQSEPQISLDNTSDMINNVASKFQKLNKNYGSQKQSVQKIEIPQESTPGHRYQSNSMLIQSLNFNSQQQNGKKIEKQPLTPKNIQIPKNLIQLNLQNKEQNSAPKNNQMSFFPSTSQRTQTPNSKQSSSHKLFQSVTKNENIQTHCHQFVRNNNNLAFKDQSPIKLLTKQNEKKLNIEPTITPPKNHIKIFSNKNSKSPIFEPSQRYPDMNLKNLMNKNTDNSNNYYQDLNTQQSSDMSEFMGTKQQMFNTNQSATCQSISQEPELQKNNYNQKKQHSLQNFEDAEKKKNNEKNLETQPNYVAPKVGINLFEESRKLQKKQQNVVSIDLSKENFYQRNGSLQNEKNLNLSNNQNGMMNSTQFYKHNEIQGSNMVMENRSSVQFNRPTNIEESFGRKNTGVSESLDLFSKNQKEQTLPKPEKSKYFSKDVSLQNSRDSANFMNFSSNSKPLNNRYAQNFKQNLTNSRNSYQQNYPFMNQDQQTQVTVVPTLQQSQLLKSSVEYPLSSRRSMQNDDKQPSLFQQQVQNQIPSPRQQFQRISRNSLAQNNSNLNNSQRRSLSITSIEPAKKIGIKLVETQKPYQNLNQQNIRLQNNQQLELNLSKLPNNFPEEVNQQSTVSSHRTPNQKHKGIQLMQSEDVYQQLQKNGHKTLNFQSEKQQQQLPQPSKNYSNYNSNNNNNTSNMTYNMYLSSVLNNQKTQLDQNQVLSSKNQGKLSTYDVFKQQSKRYSKDEDVFVKITPNKENVSKTQDQNGEVNKISTPVKTFNKRSPKQSVQQQYFAKQKNIQQPNYSFLQTDLQSVNLKSAKKRNSYVNITQKNSQNKLGEEQEIKTTAKKIAYQQIVPNPRNNNNNNSNN